MLSLRPALMLALATAAPATAVDPDDYSPLLPAPLLQTNGSITLGVSSALEFTLNASSEYVRAATRRYALIMFAWGEAQE
eukprot:SAG31_NODE_3447_length_4256_cov_2.948077_4_plen_79_part_01